MASTSGTLGKLDSVPKSSGSASWPSGPWQLIGLSLARSSSIRACVRCALKEGFRFVTEAASRKGMCDRGSPSLALRHFWWDASPSNKNLWQSTQYSHVQSSLAFVIRPCTGRNHGGSLPSCKLARVRQKCAS